MAKELIYAPLLPFFFCCCSVLVVLLLFFERNSSKYINLVNLNDIQNEVVHEEMHVTVKISNDMHVALFTME